MNEINVFLTGCLERHLFINQGYLWEVTWGMMFTKVKSAP